MRRPGALHAHTHRPPTAHRAPDRGFTVLRYLRTLCEATVYISTREAAPSQAHLAYLLGLQSYNSTLPVLAL